MNLLREVTKGDEPEHVEDGHEEDKKGDILGPTAPSGWSVGTLANHGVILSCDGFQIKMGLEELNKFWDIAESGEPGEVHDENGRVVLVEPTEDSIVLTRVNDPVYPSGVIIDLKTLKDLGIEAGSNDDEEKPAEEDTIKEGVKSAWRRSGKKIKKGFRVTSGYRKGRVVSSAAGAFKPRAKASTRMKLKIAGRRHKVIRVLKSKRTRKKSLSKRLARLNSR